MGGNAAFAVDVTDLTPSGAGRSSRSSSACAAAQRRSGRSRTSRSRLSNPARWTGGVPIASELFEYFVQAVDAAGNVGVSTNKGFYYDGAPPEPPPPDGDVSGTLTGGDPVNDWYTSRADALVDAPDGVTVEASIDGGPFGPPPSTDHRRRPAHDRSARVERRHGDAVCSRRHDDPEIVIGTPAATAGSTR